jgi:citrate lyase beta subunit
MGGTTLRFFEKLISDGMNEYFYQLPMEFNKYSDKNILRYCIGAALYMPATRKVIAQEIIAQKHPACTTIILDLEDALGNLQVAEGEEQLYQSLTDIQNALENEQLHMKEMPLLFVRVRSIEQLEKVINLLGSLQHLLTGYVFPKFSSDDGLEYLQQIAAQNALGYKLYVMPILESRTILKKESRLQELLAIRTLLEQFEPIVLNVRIGSTDFCGVLGLRRSILQTIYELAAIQDCFADIMNVFLREDSPFVLSGSVWEYFGNDLALQGLLREVERDSLNGLIGKTIIHPSHIVPVQAMYTVTHEEFTDAQRIVLQSHGEIGVEKSSYGNKMNEMKPHLMWANRILLRAQVYGVLNAGYSYEDLMKKQVVI